MVKSKSKSTTKDCATSISNSMVAFPFDGHAAHGAWHSQVSSRVLQHVLCQYLSPGEGAWAQVTDIRPEECRHDHYLILQRDGRVTPDQGCLCCLQDQQVNNSVHEEKLPWPLVSVESRVGTSFCGMSVWPVYMKSISACISWAVTPLMYTIGWWHGRSPKIVLK
ncbi:hypothetical protein E2C01_000988 [Portunus trituberculatus]|uniref:Uncharacterized protein n=1 Tax=Portunus trituberculatus TaxID=210409 RepID=A0A5B7CI43_PORTR|nr:hypothetical protein [Portunus trituberculatus]